MSSSVSSEGLQPPAGDNQVTSKSEITLKERFFRYFQFEITALQEQIDRIAATSAIGGERSDATDHCLAGIARLSGEVKDASSYIPTYDQRIYAEAIKALQDKLTETRAAVAPRARFTFKNKKNASALSLTDAAEIAAQGRRHIPGYRSPDASSQESSINPTPTYASTPVNEPEVQQLRPEIAPTSSPAILDEGKESTGSEEKTQMRQSTYPYKSSVVVNSHYGLHIVLPASSTQTTVPASITSLRRCVVDMPSSTAKGKPYTSLTIKAVKESLLICGQIEGPVHVTGIHHCVLVVSCRQFRMHNCVDVDVYLSCCSNPIIEDCMNIRFGGLPRAYALDQNYTDSPDRWDQVEDFKWIKSEPSPNWKLLDQNSTVPEEVWAEIVPGGPCWSLEDILRATKVLKD